MKTITFYFGERTGGGVGIGDKTRILVLEITGSAAETVGKALAGVQVGRGMSTIPQWISLDLAGGGKRYVNLENVLWFDITDPPLVSSPVNTGTIVDLSKIPPIAEQKSSEQENDERR